MKRDWTELLREGEGLASAGDEGSSSPPAPPAGAQEDAGDDASGSKAPASARSIYDDAGVDAPGKENTTTWPEDWRNQMVNGVDEADKALNVLKRYQSPADVAKALLATRQRVSTGEYKRQLAEDATEDQIKEWRAEQGLPEDPSGYDIPLGEGIEVDKLEGQQKAVYEGWQKVFHDTNATPEQAKTYANYMNDIVMAQQEALADHDAKTSEAQEDALRADWGADFRKNVNLNYKYLTDQLGEEGAKTYLDGRLADGTAIKHSPELAKMINHLARNSGYASNYETGEPMAGKDILAKKAEIEGLMKTDLSAYNKRKGEYGEILAELEKQGKL